jgi:hypothetical protein
VPPTDIINGCATGKTADQIYAKCSNEYVDVIVKVWQTWIPSSCVQFFLVPERYHVLWAAGVGFGAVAH